MYISQNYCGRRQRYTQELYAVCNNYQCVFLTQVTDQNQNFVSACALAQGIIVDQNFSCLPWGSGSWVGDLGASLLNQPFHSVIISVLEQLGLRHWQLRKLYMRELGGNILTRWGRLTHICNNTTIIGWGNGLSPGRRQAIIWTNYGIMLFRTIGPIFSEIPSEIHTS